MTVAASPRPASLDLTLRTPPPLGAKAAMIVLGATAFVMLFAGLRFWIVGAWMVVPFLLVDMALLIWAFRASARGSKAYERLRVTASELLLERRLPSGHSQHLSLPRAWTRVELERVSPPVCRLWLTHKNRKLLIGKHLNGREKEEVYKMIARELGG